MSFLGYVVLQHAIRLDRPVQAYAKWMERIPNEYAKSVFGIQANAGGCADSNQIAILKDYATIMPMAQEARKPIFHLKPADGALGAHFTASREAGNQYEVLARELMARIGLS